MTKKTDISWMIGGPQGSGVDSSATLFARSAAVAGYWVFGKREYHSNIKGEHSYFLIRVKNEKVLSNIDPVHLLATFEHSTAQIHGHEIVPDGALIYDPKLTDPTTIDLQDGVLLFPIAYDALIQEMADESGQNPVKLAIMKNSISVAASLCLLGMDITAMEEALKGLFTGRRAKLVELNMVAARKAYDVIQKSENYAKFNYTMEKPTAPPEKGTRLVTNGATTTALGKIKAGCRVQTYYSITPAVDECIYLEEHPEFGAVVFQCEDELAAMNMASGAATTGVRASTSTSGPGFSLMSEGIGWAGINEVPVVVFNYQRGGPSTGLPTRHEQGDLLFSVHAGHGEFPKIVTAPGDLTECFEDGFNSFNFADRYQTPVIVLCDKAMANCTQSIEIFDESGLKIDRGAIVGREIKGDGSTMTLDEAIGKFPRFKITESGISPRPLPGTPGHIFWLTGDEHTEYGHITEEPEIRIPMQEKRMKKLDLALSEIPEHLQYKLYGPEEADLTIVSWGSTKGATLDAMKVLKAEHNITVNFLQIRLMSPFPTDAVTKILSKAKRLASVEASYTGQLAQLITMRTAIRVPHLILKWTGRPISETEMVSAVREIIQKQSEKVVLTYGH